MHLCLFHLTTRRRMSLRKTRLNDITRYTEQKSMKGDLFKLKVLLRQLYNKLHTYLPCIFAYVLSHFKYIHNTSVYLSFPRRKGKTFSRNKVRVGQSGVLGLLGLLYICIPFYAHAKLGTCKTMHRKQHTFVWNLEC